MLMACVMELGGCARLGHVVSARCVPGASRFTATATVMLTPQTALLRLPALWFEQGGAQTIRSSHAKRDGGSGEPLNLEPFSAFDCEYD